MLLDHTVFIINKNFKEIRTYLTMMLPNYIDGIWLN